MASKSNKCLLALILLALTFSPCRCQKEDKGYGAVPPQQNDTRYTQPPPDFSFVSMSNSSTQAPPTTTEDAPVMTSTPVAPSPVDIPAEFRISISQTEENTGIVSSTVVCTANKPLRSCMLQLPDMPTVNFTAGFNYVKGAVYEYRGRGLLNGECGIRFLALPDPGRGEFRCMNGSYLDGKVDMTLHFSTKRTYPFGVHLKDDGHTLSANVGQPVSIPCRSSEYHALSSCHFWIPGIRQLDLRFGEFSQSAATHEYEGVGLRYGQCGLRLKNVKKQYGGVVRCWGGVGKDRIAVDSLDFHAEGGLSDGAVAAIVIVVLVGFIIAVAVLVYSWRKRRWCFSSGDGHGNANSDTEYDEIKNFAPKVPPYPSPQRLHLMAPSPHDSGYIEAVTIHNPEFDKHKANLSPPIKETHSINTPRPLAHQAPANVYEHLKEPQVKSAEKTQSFQEKKVEQKETDSVLQARPGTYMFMRGVPPKPSESKMDDPKYLSLFDPEFVKLRHSKKEDLKEEEDKKEMLYENLERVREKSAVEYDHPMFD